MFHPSGSADRAQRPALDPELFGSIPPPRPSFIHSHSRFCLLPPLRIREPARPVPLQAAAPSLPVGKPRPPAPPQGCWPLPGNPGVTGSQPAASRLRRQPQLCRALQRTRVTPNRFPRGWFCRSRADGRIKRSLLVKAGLSRVPLPGPGTGRTQCRHQPAASLLLHPSCRTYSQAGYKVLWLGISGFLRT